MLKFGIIGTGRIANRFVSTVQAEQININIACIYNPRITSANTFATKYGIEDCTDDLDSFFEQVDCVYIASPHETHYEYVIKALEHGIHVLCEKPVALQENQARSLYNLAKEKNLVLLEAIKTAYCEGFNKLCEIVKSGMIGDVVDVEAAFTRLTDEALREFQNVKYGGSVLEFGSYVLLPIIRIMGKDYEDITVHSVKADTGVDVYTKLYFKYPKGMATAKVGLGVKSEGQLIISGTKGYILATAPWWMTKHFEVRYEDPNKVDSYDYEYKGSGLQYEIKEFVNRIMDSDCKYRVSEQESIAIASVIEKFMKR